MATSVSGNVVTAKTALSHVEGMRKMLEGARVVASQFGADTTQLDKKLDNLEYIAATLTAQRASGKSGLVAGEDAGFVASRF